MMRSLLRYCLTGILTGLAGLNVHGQSPLLGLKLQDLTGRPVVMSEISKVPYSVIFFLSPGCPLCENYSLTINEMRKVFPADQVGFVGVFSGKFYSVEEVMAYMSKYKPAVRALYDPTYQVRNVLGATVTPEVYLVNRQGQVLYSGKIDNWIPALGKKRTIITEFYLRDALTAVLQGKPVPVAHVDAIGCFIE
ncbi:MAG: redoxin family protein [Bacteroidia bacterium]|nr:redoxin family protein [Bacteroidia bacterium]